MCVERERMRFCMCMHVYTLEKSYKLKVFGHHVYEILVHWNHAGWVKSIYHAHTHIITVPIGAGKRSKKTIYNWNVKANRRQHQRKFRIEIILWILEQMCFTIEKHSFIEIQNQKSKSKSQLSNCGYDSRCLTNVWTNSICRNECQQQ